MGRSGDVTAIQPKAAGSSLLAQLTNQLLRDLLRKCGEAGHCGCHGDVNIRKRLPAILIETCMLVQSSRHSHVVLGCDRGS